MTHVLSKLAWSFWRLIPANPILVRVVSGASRRVRHLWLRVGYLALLTSVVLISVIVFMGDATGLNELAKGASQTFKYASTMQLALICFLAPVFTAGAITQERDAQTYNILLSTPLTNAQIVFGSLMSRLYFLIMLLVAGLPIFFTTMVYGGVTASQIIESFALSAATAILTGAVAILISVLRAGTRRTIFSFYMTIALYLLAVYLLGRWPLTWVADAPANIDDERMSWLACLHPFLSLDVALNRVQAPDYALVASRGTLWAYALAYPSATYIAWTLLASVLMVTASMFFVRSEARKGEPGIFSQFFRRTESAGERRRKPRHVWSNPVAWREAKTKSSAAGGLTRWALILGGCAASVTVLFYHLTDSTVMTVRQTQNWLGAILMIVFAITVLLAANTAATSLTREKESKSMEVLLTTPLTSRYIIWGKLRGLVSFALPLLSVPVFSMLLFGAVSLLRDGPTPLAWIETSVEMGLVLVTFIAMVCIVCLQFSLKSRKTVRASMSSMATLVIALGILSAIGFALADGNGAVGAFFASMSPFSAIHIMTRPVELTDGDFNRLAAHTWVVRFWLLAGSLFFAGVYALLVLSFYKSIVRNFDMIVRKQSAT